MTNQDTKKKIGIYGTNLLTPSLVGLLQSTPAISEAIAQIPKSGVVLDKIADSANPYGAIIFGALDLVGAISPKIKNSKLTRFAHLGGAAVYGVRTVLDLFSIAKGDYESLVNFAFDGSMLYQLGKDTFKNYRANDLWNDITKW